jgi:hypothetical protein
VQRLAVRRQRHKGGDDCCRHESKAKEGLEELGHAGLRVFNDESLVARTKEEHKGAYLCASKISEDYRQLIRPKTK